MLLSKEDKRRLIVNECFEKLPEDLREWINYLHFRIHDDYILQGEDKVRWFKNYIENGGKIYYKYDGQQKN